MEQVAKRWSLRVRFRLRQPCESERRTAANCGCPSYRQRLDGLRDGLKLGEHQPLLLGGQGALVDEVQAIAIEKDRGECILGSNRAADVRHGVLFCVAVASVNETKRPEAIEIVKVA